MLEGLHVHAPIPERRGAIAEAVRVLDSEGIAVEDVAIRRPTLDDVFIALTGDAAAEAAGAEEGAEAEGVEA